jgi:hypothetical protein
MITPWRTNFLPPKATLSKVLAETPCASDAEFLKKLRYLHAQETRIGKTPNAAHPPHYLTLKLRALCCVLRRLPAGGLSWPEGW